MDRGAWLIQPLGSPRSHLLQLSTSGREGKAVVVGEDGVGEGGASTLRLSGLAQSHLLGCSSGGHGPLEPYFLCLLCRSPTDLEVVLEKKGNMDEAHIDKVWLVLIIPHLPQPPETGSPPNWPQEPGPGGRWGLLMAKGAWSRRCQGAPAGPRPTSLPHLQGQGPVAALNAGRALDCPRPWLRSIWSFSIPG